MNIIVPKMAPSSFAQNAVAHIRHLIEVGELSPNDRLPSIREFAETNAVSPATAQRVYSTLRDEGLVVSEHGADTRIAPNAGGSRTEQSAVTMFWSYAHKDDENSKGAVSALLEAIKAEYELQTGTELNVFSDKGSIDWGNDWRKCIESALLNTVFFVPVLTPTYLKRPACLDELRTAYSFYKENGIERGIYPIRFVNIERALTRFEDDKLANLIGNTQGINFYESGTRDPASIGYIEIVSRIVAKLICIDDELGSQYAAGEIGQPLDTRDGNGTLDDLAEMEEALANQGSLLSDLIDNMNLIGKLAAQNSEEIAESDRNGKGFAGRLAIARAMAIEMRPIAEEVVSYSGQFSKNVQSIDRGVKAYVSLCVAQDGCGRSTQFEQGVLTLVETGKLTLEQCRSFINVLNKTKKLSRDLRAPIGLVTQGLDLFCSNERYFEEWNDEIKLLAANGA